MSLVGMDSSDSESKALPRLLTLIKFLMPLTNTQMNIKISISKESPNSLKSKFFALHGTCPKALLKLLKTQEWWLSRESEIPLKVKGGIVS